MDRDEYAGQDVVVVTSLADLNPPLTIIICKLLLEANLQDHLIQTPLDELYLKQAQERQF